MAREKLTLEMFGDHLNQLITTSDELLVMHSGIWTFAHLFNLPPKQLLPKLLEVFFDVIDTTKTLIMPAYTADFPKTRVYDLKESKPTTGKLVELFLNDERVFRTRQPIDSYAVVGPKSREILELPCTTAWGKDSLMGYLHKKNARFITLGLPWELSCSYMHYAEELLQVPYRYYKCFKGKLIDENRVAATCQETMYVRPWECETQFNYLPVIELLKAKKLIEKVDCPYYLEAASIQDIAACTSALITKDPYALVVNKEEVKEWVRFGKEKEISSLKEDERMAAV